MWRGMLMAAVTMAATACGGISKQEASRQVDQLVVLYQENRPQFVVQKQQLEQASSCSRTSALREAVDDKVRATAMSPDQNETVKLVKMELEQAEKTCRAK